jgi:HSP20 family protein
MDELFTDFDRDLFSWPVERFGQTDIYEKDGNLVYEIELPGLKRDEVELKVEDGRLTISGETKRDERIDAENYFRMGRRYGKFQRVFPLPEQADDPKKIQAQFDNGILRVTVPLKEAIHERQKPIEIKIN